MSPSKNPFCLSKILMFYNMFHPMNLLFCLFLNLMTSFLPYPMILTPSPISSVAYQNADFSSESVIPNSDTHLSSPSNDHITQPKVRKSSRVPKYPSYLANYHCSLAKFIAITPSNSLIVGSVSGIKYPLSSNLSYFKLFNSYKAFFMSVSSQIEPASFKQAIQYPKWCDAMATEIKALKGNKTWCITSLPPNKQVVGCKWIYKIKYSSNGSIERYKAQLVGKRYT